MFLGVAIAGPDHLHLPAPLVQFVLQPLGHQLRVDQQRRTGLGPDGAVLLGRLLRSADQHDGVQDGPPEEGRQLDHPPVGEELTQVAAHLRHLRPVGGAQLDQQDGGAGGRDGIVHGMVHSTDGKTRFIANTLSKLQKIIVAGFHGGSMCPDSTIGRL